MKNLSKTPLEKKKILIFVKELIIDIAVAFIISIAINFFIGFTTVNGLSMYPTLNDGDFLLLEKVSTNIQHDLKKGDIIVFKKDIPGDGKKNLIKRIIGLEGDKVIVKNNEVFINGKKIDENYLSEDVKTYGDIDIVIPKNKIFVMGDNRENSMDSRDPNVGLVSENEVVGTKTWKLWNKN